MPSPSPHVAEIKALGHALRLYSAVRRVDDLADDWIDKKWREKKLEELDEDDRAEYYKLKEEWERAIESFRDKTSRFMKRFGKSPFLRYEPSEVVPGWGRLILGFRSPQARGYRIVELHYPEWFIELHIETEGLSKEEVLEIAPEPPSPLYPPPTQYVKVRFLKEVPAIVGADIKTYGPFKEGDIVELPKENAEVLVKQGLASYELVPAPPVVPPVKFVLTDEEKSMLNIFFLDKLKGAGIGEPEKYKPEFERALDVSKDYEHNLTVARNVADDIIERVKPIPKLIEVHVKVKVSEGEDVGTYVAMLMFEAFEVTFVGLTSTPALKTFLDSGEEWVDFTEQYRMAGFEAEEMARIRVYWKYPEDVEFTEKAKEWWNIYYMTYFRPELEALTVPVLTDIAKIKQVRVGKTKDELIASILGLPPPVAPPVPPPPAVPPKPPEKAFKEFPSEVDKFRETLTSEAEDIFRAYDIFEHWVKMRDSVVAMIDEVIRKYWHLPMIEAMRVIRKDFMARIHEEFVKKLRPPPPPKPPPPEVIPPPTVKPPYPYIPPAVEYVELEAEFQTFLKEVGITMEEYRRLEAIGKFTMREEYRRWKARPYSS